MSEFLLIGWNVAQPQIDVGDDFLVLHDYRGDLRRVQIKAANAKKAKTNIKAIYKINKKRLLRQPKEEIFYIFLYRYKKKWSDPLIINQEDLIQLLTLNSKRISRKNTTTITFKYSRAQKVTYGRKNIDITKYLNNYSPAFRTRKK